MAEAPPAAALTPAVAKRHGCKVFPTFMLELAFWPRRHLRHGLQSAAGFCLFGMGPLLPGVALVQPRSSASRNCGSGARTRCFAGTRGVPPRGPQPSRPPSRCKVQLGKLGGRRDGPWARCGPVSGTTLKFMAREAARGYGVSLGARSSNHWETWTMCSRRTVLFVGALSVAMVVGIRFSRERRLRASSAIDEVSR